MAYTAVTYALDLECSLRWSVRDVICGGLGVRIASSSSGMMGSITFRDRFL